MENEAFRPFREGQRPASGVSVRRPRRWLAQPTPDTARATRRRAGGSALLAWALTCACVTGGVRPVTDPDQRYAVGATGCSVLPPRGSGWYVMRDDAGGVAFAKQPQGASTVGAMALQVEIHDPDAGTPEGLLAFVERWLDAGGPADGNGETVVLTTASSPRCRLLERSARIEPSTGAVHFDARIEERDNPRFPGVTLVQIIRDNVICRIPGPEGHYLMVGASERHPTSQGQDRLTAEDWERELRPFVGSLQYP